MVSALIQKVWILGTLLYKVGVAQFILQASPTAWNSGISTRYASGYSYISDGVSHIAQITFYKGNSPAGDIYRISVTSGAPESQTKPSVPVASSTICDSTPLITNIINLTPTQRVVKIEAYKRDFPASPYEWKLFRIVFYLNDSSI